MTQTAMSDAEMLQRIADAEAAVAALADEYLDYARADIAQINAGIAAVKNAVDAGSDSATLVADVFAVAHNIKGQAGSFGFPLLTEIAASICGHTRHAKGADAAMADALLLHGAALAEVLDQNLKDDGGAAGSAIMARLSPIIARED
ncbi:MAG TPA: Hpt domain-containing protein [Micropepsaceae bacterium]|nr:Hpt domain-containing protein [Micropepsaceae bacterium]